MEESTRFKLVAVKYVGKRFLCRVEEGVMVYGMPEIFNFEISRLQTQEIK